jgi:rubrerythrin
MNIKDSFVKSYDKVKNSAIKLGNDIKLERKRASLFRELNDMYNTLGKIRYSELSSGENADIESKRISEEITRLLTEIDELELIAKRKCTHCGMLTSKDNEYCPNCGKKLGE